MSEPTNQNESDSPVTFEEAPGKKFFVDSIEFARTPDAQSLAVRIDHGNGTAVATLSTENTEDMERLVIEYMERAQAVVPDLYLNFAEIVWNSDKDLCLNLSVNLPGHVGILSDEGFKLLELAQVITENSGNTLSVEFSEYLRGNVIPLRIPSKFQSLTFKAHQQMMWAGMALEGFKENRTDMQYGRRVREQRVEKKVPILRQIMWKIDTPKSREYSIIVVITVVTYLITMILCAWIESLKR